MSVTLSEVKRAAKAHRAPLAGESAGYLVLAIADQVLSAPRMVQGSDVQLTEDGALRVLSGPASSDADAELTLRRALDALLLVASSGSAALTRASRRTAPVGLAALVRELEAALIPVNRGAARRALARIHRETARALSSGSLPEEEVEAALPMATVAPVAPPEVALLVEASIGSAPVALEVAPVNATVAAPTAPKTSAPEPFVDDLEPIHAVTGARDLKLCADVVVAIDYDLDVLLEDEPDTLESEPADAPTVVRARVAPIPDLIVTDPLPHEPVVDIPADACTRPEPVVLRKALRSELVTEDAPPVSVALPRTPTLGSLAKQLPILAPAQIAELDAAQAERADEQRVGEDVEPREVAEFAESASREAELTICSAPVEECTEQMPEVAPLHPGVAIIASRKSDLSELLESFQVAAHDSNQGLCRTIKELAGLDLTPAPFSALIR